MDAIIQATGSVTMFSIGSIKDAITATNGGASIECGATLEGDVTASGDITAVALGDISSDLTAGGGATVTGWSDVTGKIAANGGGATVNVNGDLDGNVNASESITANVVGDASGNLTAGGAVSVTSGGETSGQIIAGAGVNVASGGECSATITAGGGVGVQSFADISSQIVATGDVDLETWSDIYGASVQTGGNASLSSIGNLNATVTANDGTISAASEGTTQLWAQAGGEITVKSFGEVAATNLVSNNGGVGVDVYDAATLVVQAAQDVGIFATGDLDGTVTAGGSIDADTLGTISGTYSAGGDASASALGGATAQVTAGGFAVLSSFGDATGVSVNGGPGAYAWSGGALSGTINATLGDASAFAFGAENVLVDAATFVYVEGLSAVVANVVSGLDTTIEAAGTLSATVKAGGEANLFSGADLSANATASADIAMVALGNLTGTASAGANLKAAAYGNINATDFEAAGDVTLIWARGDISGSISADGAIDEVNSHSSIDATFTAPNIGTVAAFGPIGGALNASNAISLVESGGAITAALNSPSVGAVLPYQHGLLTDWPQTPVLDESEDIAARNAAQAALEALAAQIAANKQAALARSAAAKHAAEPGYEVSIGDEAAAQAAFDNAGLALASLIAASRAQAERVFSADRFQLKMFFSQETARLVEAKSYDQLAIDVITDGLAKLAAQRLSDAFADDSLPDEIMTLVTKQRDAALAKLDHFRDVDRASTFEDDVRDLLLDRAQTALDLLGVFDPTFFLDGANSIIYFMRGKLLDGLLSGLAALPYAFDWVKAAKFSKAAHVADDYLELAGKGIRYADDGVEAATLMGRANKGLGFATPLGCFGAETRVELATIEPHALATGAGIEWAAIEVQPESRWLWASLLAGTAFVGHWAAARRLRRKNAEKARQAALDGLFSSDAADDDDDDLRLLAASSHGPSQPSVAAASCAAFADLEREQGTAVLDAAAELEAARVAPALSRLSYDKNLTSKNRRRRNATLPETKAKRATRDAARPRRHSGFGLLWLATFLTLAGWVGFAPRAPQPRAQSVPAAASGYVSPPAETVQPRTKRIADVVVGDRVKSDNPTGEQDLSLGAEVNPESWRKLLLRASKADGSWADVELLRPLSWIDERGASVGGTAPISVPECGIDGDATVLAIEPCPPIMPGKGRVVTGTFHHSSAHVLDLEIDGLAAPIITTVNHLFWSADRAKFVRADSLNRGERLRGREGFVAVRNSTRRRDTIPVFNLEVHINHVYHVSTAGILVHNGTPNPCGPLIGIPNATRLTDAEQATAARLLDNSPGLKLSESAHEGAEYVDQFGRSYEQFGNPKASQFWNEQEVMGSLTKHLRKSNDFTVIDLTGFMPAQIEIIRRYLDNLPREVQDKIIRIGF